MNSPVRSIAQLRKEAEAILRENPASAPVLKTADVQKLLHELQVYETELEIQNEDLRKAQIEIVESRDRFAELYDFAPVGYLTLDGETRITEANLTAVKMFGLSRSEIKNSRIQFSGMVSSESQDDWFRFRRRMFVGDEKQSCELDCCYGDGPAIRCQIESTVMRGSDGSGDRCMVALLDISGRKKAQDALRSSTKLVDALVTHDGLVIADSRGRITEMNNAALAMFGFGSRDDMLRVMSGEAKMMDLTGADGKELSIGQIPMNRVCAGETFFGQEYSVYVHPTKRRWCASFSGAPVLDNAGKIEYAVLTIRDISERKQAEWSAQAAYELTQHKLNEVAEYKNRLEAVMHTLPVGVAVLDTQGGTVLANLAFDTIWGNPKPAATNIGDYIQDKAEWADTGKTILPDEWASSRALRSGETVVGQIIRITGFDGVQRVVLNSAAPILDTKGEVAGCAVAVQDISEHMVLEKALRQSEERYRHLVQYAPAGIYDVDFATGRFTEVNDVMCRVLGYTRDELLSMTAFEILDDQSKALFASRIRKAQARERLDESFEYRVKVKDGRVIWAILNVTFRWEDKRIVGATVVAHDITERKQMEEKLQTTLQRFYLILSNMHFGILLVTNENRVEFVNQSFCDMFGLRDRPDDLTKLSADEMIDTIRPCYTKPDEAIARIRELVLLGQTVSGEDVGMSRGRSLLRDFIPIRIGEKLYGRLWVHADITERKRAEEELRESETKLRAIFETSVDAIGVVKAGIHVSANPAYLALFGYSDNVGLIGKSITGLIAPSQRPVIAENVHLRARGDSAPSSYETRGLRKDGTEFDMDVRVSAYAVDGEVASVVILRDITDRKKAEEEIARHLEELRVSNEELARFNRVAVDRELRMIELKKQVNELCGKAGMEPRYKVEVGE